MMYLFSRMLTSSLHTSFPLWVATRVVKIKLLSSRWVWGERLEEKRNKEEAAGEK